MEKGIYWLNEDGVEVASEIYDFIPIFKGMQVSITKMGTFEVINWHYHKGKVDEKPGLRITVREIEKSKLIWPFRDFPQPF